MQYNPACSVPTCFLTMDNGKEEQKSLQEIQAYIESENKRLEQDSQKSFEDKEIKIRMEYRYCPNMIVIDTPGLIHPPKGKQLTNQQRALAQAAREAEQLVLNKLRTKEYIILCVEDTTDWRHSTTRNIVAMADPDFQRTVLVTTKLDTKLPQFSEPADIENFLMAPSVFQSSRSLLGGPFFTSVPSGRVSEQNKELRNNDAFVDGLQAAENEDRKHISNSLSSAVASQVLDRVGVSKLRTFLESRVEESYRRDVTRIVPLLQSELQRTKKELEEVNRELSSLSPERLEEHVTQFRELFSKNLNELIEGSVVPDSEVFGETLEAEEFHGGTFNLQNRLTPQEYKQVLITDVGHPNEKLFGGAQYKRMAKQFEVSARLTITDPPTTNEILNAEGVCDFHNGGNPMRSACTIAMHRATKSFFPLLESLESRASYLFRRMFPIVEQMVRQEATKLPMMSRTFVDRVRRIYDEFLQRNIDFCMTACRYDIESMTQFVTLEPNDDKGGPVGMYSTLPNAKTAFQIYTMAVEGAQQRKKMVEKVEASQSKSKVDAVLKEWSAATGGKKLQKPQTVPSRQIRLRDSVKSFKPDESLALSKVDNDAELSDYYRMLQLADEMVAGINKPNRSQAMVSLIVCHIISCWRNQFARSATTKFNSYVLTQFKKGFANFLREELRNLDFGTLFDISETQRQLRQRQSLLLAETDANSKLQERFINIAKQLKVSAAQEKPSSDGSTKSDDGSR